MYYLKFPISALTHYKAVFGNSILDYKLGKTKGLLLTESASRDDDVMDVIEECEYIVNGKE